MTYTARYALAAQAAGLVALTIVERDNSWNLHGEALNGHW
jgi:hypothetical protein